MARILIVEDEAHSARALECFLTSLDHEVRLADRAGQALDIATEFHPQVVLTDLLLAGEQDGIAVARELARRNGAPPVILMSGLPLQELKERARGEPVCEIQTKPLRLQRIRDAIDRALTDGSNGKR